MKLIKQLTQVSSHAPRALMSQAFMSMTLSGIAERVGSTPAEVRTAIVKMVCLP